VALLLLQVPISAFAARSTLVNGYLCLPRIDIDGFGAVRNLFSQAMITFSPSKCHDLP
jgi:hypothetical protein